MPNTARPTTAVPALVGKLYDVVAKLEGLFKDRKFTLDGHLVGSIGEVLAADKYGLTLLSMVEEKHDAKTSDGRLVQIKTTQAKSVGLRSEPDHLLVLKLSANGSIDEVYNGPGAAPWKAAGKLQSTGQRPIGVAKLRALMDAVPLSQRIPVSQ